MTLKYRILKKVMLAINFRSRFDKDEAEMIAFAKKLNAKTKVPALTDKEIEVNKIYVDGALVLKFTHKKKTDRANLFIIGGGMIKSPRPDSIRKALKIAKETGLDMYIPYYPLCTDYPITEPYKMIYATYEKMLEEYTAENISVLGTSSGGNIALGLIAYMNDIKSSLPKPASIIPISPGTCVMNDEEWKRMQTLDKVDVLIPAKFMKTAEGIMRHGDDSVPDYMIWLQKGDFTDCPKVYFMYGSDETLYACAPSFEEAMKKYGVEYEMIVGEGLFHCYPVFPITKESKAGWEQMIHIMKNCYR